MMETPLSNKKFREALDIENSKAILRPSRNPNLTNVETPIKTQNSKNARPIPPKIEAPIRTQNSNNASPIAPKLTEQ